MTRLLKLALLTLAIFASVAASAATKNKEVNNNAPAGPQEVVLGADRTDQYVPLLKGKRIALLSNQTGITSKGKHVLDVMIENGLKVTVIFSPEHGFRGKADAGEHVSSSVDEKTGIPIASLYDGKTGAPSKESMAKFDVLVTDLQDVGLRYYTYYITMARLMDACIEHGKEFVVFDRPNPNGMYVDGPILDMSLKSGVGHFPICTVHGMTMAELALMANGEGWLKGGKKVKLTVIPCLNYTHQTRYTLPVAPSPNLPNMLSIYLYPSICYFEGTTVSLGRGTDLPFQGYGHPNMTCRPFQFTPTSRFGAKTPPQQDKLCFGVDLRGMKNEDAIARGIDLTYVVDAYNDLRAQGKQFLLKEGKRNFFNLLMGNTQVWDMIVAGKSATEIKASWQGDVMKFKKQRKPYLLYAE
ncbi:MAG: DUF1343 domain-containing protein [Bacteroidales bacterium]|nr:DUF1343 domain-containing protein [Bacteroidales bacterium]